MSEIGDIRDALKTRLEGIAGIRVADETPGAATVTGQATGAVISYNGTQYQMDFAGNAIRNFTVTLLAGLISDRSAVAKLDAYCDIAGSTSVYAALNGEIANAAHDVRVVSDSGYQGYKVGEGEAAPEYLGVEFTLEVMV